MKHPWNLSDRELEVCRAVIKYGVDKIAARELGISHRTVEAHLAAAKFKMGVGNRTHVLLTLDRLQRSAA